MHGGSGVHSVTHFKRPAHARFVCMLLSYGKLDSALSITSLGPSQAATVRPCVRFSQVHCTQEVQHFAPRPCCARPSRELEVYG